MVTENILFHTLDKAKDKMLEVGKDGETLSALLEQIRKGNALTLNQQHDLIYIVQRNSKESDNYYKLLEGIVRSVFGNFRNFVNSTANPSPKTPGLILAVVGLALASL